MRKTLKTMLIIFLCVALASCHSSLTEMKIPTGPFPPIRYGVLEIPEMSAILDRGNLTGTEVYFKHKIFDYENMILQDPRFSFYDCEIAGFYESTNMLYYYFRLIRPVEQIDIASMSSGNRFLMLAGDPAFYLKTYVGAINVVSGQRVQIMNLQDLVFGRSVPVGDTFTEGETVLITSEEFTTEEFGDLRSDDVISIFETPDSSAFSYEVEDLQPFFVKITDMGEVFVLRGTTFWCYKILPMLELLYTDDISRAAGYETLNRSYMSNAGWDVRITDVEPLIITPQNKFVQYNMTAVIDIAFMYCYTPPVISGETENTAPEAPSMEVNENMSFDEVGEDDYDDEATEDELMTDAYGNERPYYVFAHYRRMADSAAQFSFWMNSNNDFLNIHDGFVGMVPIATAGGFRASFEMRVPEMYFHRAGDYRNYGYLLICTPRAIVLYDGLIGSYRFIRSRFGNDFFGRPAGDNDSTTSYLDWIRFGRWGGNTLSFTYRTAVPIRYGWDSAEYPYSNTSIPGGEIKYFRMRSNSQSIRDLGIVLNREHTQALLARYSELMAPPSASSAGGIGGMTARMMETAQIAQQLGTDGSDFALLRNSATRFWNFVRTYSNEEYDRYDPNNMTWDENATYISQQNTAAYSDINFLKQGSTVYVSTYRESGKKDSGFPAGRGYFNFTTQTKPVWQVSGENMGIYQPNTRLKYENAGVHLRMSPMPIVLHATLEYGLSVYLEKNQANVIRLEFGGGAAVAAGTPITARGRYFVEGYRVSGAFYNVFHINSVAAADCLLVGFMGADRIATWLDLKDASALVVKLGNDEWVEPGWIYLP